MPLESFFPREVRTMSRSRWLGVFGSFLLLSLGLAGPASAQDHRAGTGRADITPDGPVWMAGYGNRNKPSEGVEQPLNVKALALQYQKDTPLLLITADIIGFPR